MNVQITPAQQPRKIAIFILAAVRMSDLLTYTYFSAFIYKSIANDINSPNPLSLAKFYKELRSSSTNSLLFGEFDPPSILSIARFPSSLRLSDSLFSKDSKPYN